MKVNEVKFQARFDAFYSFYALSNEHPMSKRDAYKMMRAGYEIGMGDMLEIVSVQISQRSKKV
jgi:hypothetical protein